MKTGGHVRKVSMPGKMSKTVWGWNTWRWIAGILLTLPLTVPLAFLVLWGILGISSTLWGYAGQAWGWVPPPAPPPPPKTAVEIKESLDKQRDKALQRMQGLLTKSTEWIEVPNPYTQTIKQGEVITYPTLGLGGLNKWELLVDRDNKSFINVRFQPGRPYWSGCDLWDIENHYPITQVRLSPSEDLPDRATITVTPPATDPTARLVTMYGHLKNGQMVHEVMKAGEDKLWLDGLRESQVNRRWKVLVLPRDAAGNLIPGHLLVGKVTVSVIQVWKDTAGKVTQKIDDFPWSKNDDSVLTVHSSYVPYAQMIRISTEIDISPVITYVECLDPR